MTESSLIIALLEIISICVVIITAVLCVTAIEFRGTLKRLNSVLIKADHGLDEIRNLLKRIRHIVKRTTNISNGVERLVHSAYDTASEVFERWATFKGNFRKFFTGLAKNGVGAGPRFNGRRR